MDPPHHLAPNLPPPKSSPVSCPSPKSACMDCVTECTEPLCPSADLVITSQCTDQCVVIACDDPDHASKMTCPEDKDHLQCDFICDRTNSCVDCTGLDEFLRCCTDYHWYPNTSNQGRSHSGHCNPALSWDPCFDAFLCECIRDSSLPKTHPTDTAALSTSCSTSSPTTSCSAGPSPPTSGSSVMSHEPSAYTAQRPHALASPTFNSNPPGQTPASTASSNLSSQPQYLPSDVTTNLSSLQPLENTRSDMLTCMWDNCQTMFSSLSELVGHVNLEHLRLPSTSPSSTTPASHNPSQGSSYPKAEIDSISSNSATASSVSCLWRNCNLYSTPESIPGPSGYNGSPSKNQTVGMLDFLASHLLQDHLGLPANAPLNHNYPSGIPAQSPPASLMPKRNYQDVSNPELFPSSSVSTPTTLSPSVPCSQPPYPPISPVSGTFVSQSPISQPSPSTSQSHSGDGSLACQWAGCSLSFPTCDELTAHLTAAHVGSGKAQYECFWEGCSRNGDNGFASKQKICRHLQSHTGHRPFQCQICQQNFSEAATLQQHMRRHTRERPYACDYPGCGKAFAITGALTIHKRTHNGQKPFKCTYCDRAFAESSNLSKHLRTHTGARPYSCAEPGCNKSFARPDQLTRHMGVHKRRLLNNTAAGLAIHARSNVESTHTTKPTSTLVTQQTI